MTLVAVTKDKAAEYVRAAATLGVTDFGENYVKEALGKMDELEGLPVRWHFIGALQSNKTRPVAERFAWVHSLDRMSVARRLSEQRPFHAPSLKVCIQVALVPEPAKGGTRISLSRKLKAGTERIKNQLGICIELRSRARRKAAPVAPTANPQTACWL